MTIRLSSKKLSGLTLVEALVIIAVGLVVAGIYLPELLRPRHHVGHFRTQCANNLKQVATAFRVWSGDHNDRFPMEVSTNEGGTKEFATTLQISRHFQVMADEFGNSPKVLICPDDNRVPIDAFDPTNVLRNENISYFIGIDATDSTNSQAMFLAGDRNISDSDKIRRGFFFRGTNQFVQWSLEMHSAGKSSGAGNSAISDGSVQQVTSSALRKLWQNTGIATNRLVLP